MEVTIRVNDIFEELSISLENCHKLIRLLLKFKEQCICHKNQLNEEIDEYMKIYNKLDSKPVFKRAEPREHCTRIDKDNLVRVDPIGSALEPKRNENGRYLCEWVGCGKEFTEKKSLKGHYTIHTGEKPFKCDKCDQCFRQRYQLNDHMSRTHTNVNQMDETTVQTDSIDKELNESQIKDSLNSSNVVGIKSTVRLKRKQYLCQWEGCGKQCAGNTALIRHRRTHTGEKPFKCCKCGQCFAQRNHLTEHIFLKHTDVSVPEPLVNDFDYRDVQQYTYDGQYFNCNICEHKTDEMTSIRRHLFTHSKTRPFKCSFSGCSKTFNQKGNYTSHYWRIHCQNKEFNDYSVQNSIVQNEEQVNQIREKKTVYKCRHCPQVFPKRAELRGHLNTTHVEENKFVCRIESCSARFRDLNKLVQHMKQHEIEFVCSFDGCHYKTYLRHRYQAHLAKHSGISLLKCDICGEDMNFLGQMLRHKQTVHSIEYPLTCDWPGCQNVFKSTIGLYKHMTLHTDERKWVCSWPECGNKYRHRVSLNAHMASHENQRRFECNVCHKTFNHTINLRKHRKKIHKIIGLK